ncbi:MAG: hypothetical protein KAU52_10260 [Methanosarcinales archaeon]|nr:hypothetical protein [Methanosarcinales archaeon]
MDATTSEWKDISPDDITSEPGWDTKWELIRADVAGVKVACSGISRR